MTLSFTTSLSYLHHNVRRNFLNTTEFHLSLTLDCHSNNDQRGKLKSMTLSSPLALFVPLIKTNVISLAAPLKHWFDIYWGYGYVLRPVPPPEPPPGSGLTPVPGLPVMPSIPMQPIPPNTPTTPYPQPYPQVTPESAEGVSRGISFRELFEDLSWAPSLSQLTIGAVIGFATGYALKKVSKMLLFAIGIGFVLVQVAVYYGFITVDWLRVQDTFNPWLTPESLEQSWYNMLSILTANLPFVSGFTPMFILGLRQR